MKESPILALLLLGFVTASVQAGQEVYKQVAPPPPPPVYGTGFYGAIDMGANVYQDLGSHTFDRSFNDVLFAGDALDLNVKLEPKHEVGFFGGIKLGYVFGTGVVRPTIEGDFFYNGFKPGFDVTGNAAFTPLSGGPTFTGSANGSFSTWVNTGAFMGNFILRFAPGNQRFQPYIGAGVGGFYAQTAGVNVDVEGFHRQISRQTIREFVRENGVSNEFADLAWQAIAGADYY
jgi:opacity protein-like surface antigen